MLGDIALSILKLVSSHRGLTYVCDTLPTSASLTMQSSPDIFDEQTRKLFQARLPAWNPFGDDEVPAKFNEFDIFTKVITVSHPSSFELGLINGNCPTRFECYNNLPNGRWFTPNASEIKWTSRRI
jgi:hypothetical protein